MVLLKCWCWEYFCKLNKPCEDNKHGKDENLDAGFLLAMHRSSRYYRLLRCFMHECWGNKQKLDWKLKNPHKKRKEGKTRENPTSWQKPTHWADSKQTARSERTQRIHSAPSFSRYPPAPSSFLIFPLLSSLLRVIIPIIPDCNLETVLSISSWKNKRNN